MNNNIVFGIGGTVLGFIIGALFIPAISPYGNGGFGMMSGRNDTLPAQRLAGNTRMTNNIDRHFIEQMIPHHEGAVAMARLAQRRSTRPEITTLATAIIEGQTKEITDMTGWYKEWFGTDVRKIGSGMMGGGMMGGGMMFGSGMHMDGQEDMTTLENAQDFDKAFLEAMIPHHQLALMMVRMLESGTNRPEMLQLAQNIETSQSREIAQMQEWYATWYK
jgi:uncharacterized protein (DUF305 family)